MRTRLPCTLATVGLVVAAAASNLSCGAVECGPGTLEKDGTCVPANLSFQNECIPDPVTICDPDTTTEQVDTATGAVLCVGSGADRTLCTTELPCPTPLSGKVTLCGRIWDTQTEDFFPPAAVTTGDPCTAVTQDGPCSLQMRFYDALAFSDNPSGATPIVPGSFELDDCGRYIAHNLTQPSFGYIGIGVDDATGTADRHKLTGVATANALAKPARRFPAYITRNATDTAWSQSAGNLSPTFSTRGVLAMVFRYQNAPRAGVSVRKGGQPITADDYYFSDLDKQRTTVATAQATTGGNGTGLVINVPQATEMDGTGGLPTGCSWPAAPGAAIPGVTFVTIRNAVVTGGASPCP